jgi:hypothetical protein
MSKFNAKVAKNGSTYYVLYCMSKRTESELKRKSQSRELIGGFTALKRLIAFDNGDKLSFRVELLHEQNLAPPSIYTETVPTQPTSKIGLQEIKLNIGTINFKPHSVEVYRMNKVDVISIKVSHKRNRYFKRPVSTISNNPSQLFDNIKELLTSKSLYHEDLSEKVGYYTRGLRKTNPSLVRQSYERYYASHRNIMPVPANDLVKPDTLNPFLVKMFLNSLEESVMSFLYKLVYKKLRQKGFKIADVNPAHLNSDPSALILMARSPAYLDLYRLAVARYKERCQSTVTVNPKFVWQTGLIPSVLSKGFVGKDLKQLIKFCFGNNGKVITRLVLKNILQTNNLVPAHTYPTKASDQPLALPDALKSKICMSINLYVFLGAFACKTLFTIDEMQKIMQEKPIQMTGFPIALGSQELQGMVMMPMQEWRDFNADGEGRRGYRFLPCVPVQRPRKDYMAPFKLFRTIMNLFPKKRQFSFIFNGGYSVHDLQDTLIQWYSYGHKIQLPTNLKTLRELHDYISKEVNKLKHADFPLTFANRPEFLSIDGVDTTVLSADKKHRHLKIIVPKTNHELIDWGQKLSNCIGTYGDRVNSSKDQFLLGVEEFGKLKYAIEINRGYINQFHGHGNSRPDMTDKEVIESIIKQHGLVGHHFDGREVYQNHIADAARYAMGPLGEMPARVPVAGLDFMLGLAEGE